MIASEDPAVPTARLSGGGMTALLACGLFITIGLYAPGLVLPQIARSFAGTPHVELLTQLIGSIASFTFAIGAPFAGALIARHGCRRVILPSLILFTVFGVAPGLLDDLWAILVTRAVLGFAVAGIFTGGLTGIGALPEDQRARMFGWFSVVGGAAAIGLFPIVGMLGHYGWHLPFAVYLLGVAVAPLVLLMPRTLGQVKKAAAERVSAQGLLGPAMIGLLVIAALAGLGMVIGPVYAPIYLTTLGVTDTRLLAIPVTLGSIASVVASGSYGFFYRKLGMWGVSLLCMLVMGVALLAAGTAGSIPLFTVAIVFHSASIALVSPHISATALALSPAGKGSQAIGIANGMLFGSQLLFPFVSSWIRAEAGVTGVFLAFGAAGLLIALAIAARLGTARRRPVAT